MLVYGVITLVTLFTLSSSAPSPVKWSSCPPTAFDVEESDIGDIAKCTVYTSPLCHPGVCKTPKSANSTVDVFVRILPATKIKPANAKNVWILQGGPMHSPDTMLPPMMALYERLERKVNVYTMDYRGTGRSTRLMCEVFASSGVATIDPAKVPQCAQELQDKYGNLASFSTTSAAKDLVNFISDYTNDFSTTIYGVGYGTMWVERVMHLDPPEVTGYVLDNVMTTSGAKPEEFFYETSVGAYAGEIGDVFLSLCAEDRDCSARFKAKGLEAAIQRVMTKFDNNPGSKCATLVKTLKSGQDKDSPSLVLRYLLGALLFDSNLRTLIPPVVYRLLRCAPKDIGVLKHFLTVVNQGLEPQGEAKAHSSAVLDNLVAFSEKWESPTPSVSKLKVQFEENTLNCWISYVQVPAYCAFSKEKSRMCNKLNFGEYDGNGIIYERDEYWNKSVTIPHRASVLLMSTKMDPNAPHRYAKTLLDVLEGENKEMITFQYTAGDNLVDSGTGAGLCGLTVLSSYVQGNNNLDKLDKSCMMDEKKALNWIVPIGYQYVFLSTDDAYDGAFNSSFNAGVKEQ